MALNSIWWLSFAVALAACGSVKHDPGTSTPDAGGAGNTPDAFVGPACTANQPLRCSDKTLTSCNAEGTGETTSPCALGCSTSAPRCNDVAPSNGLAQYLDMVKDQPDLVLDKDTTISTTDGSVLVGKEMTPVSVTHIEMPQSNGPPVQVFVVKTLVANKVTITGTKAFALVSDGDIAINGVFTATGSAGTFNDAVCRGKVGGFMGEGMIVTSGSGGGGFGTQGGIGGDAIGAAGSPRGGAGGQPTGTVELVPLRGGCDAGPYAGGANLYGSGGGAIQLVSRTKITVAGALAANGTSLGAGGSGGGILLEAPTVEVTGAVVANGGGGSAGGFFPTAGQDGQLNATPAAGGVPPTNCGDCGKGGNGAAGGGIGGAGDAKFASQSNFVYAGFGGGGAGRIRVNTPPAALHTTGVFSPSPSTGSLATR